MKTPKSPKTIKIGSETVEVASAKKAPSGPATPATFTVGPKRSKSAAKKTPKKAAPKRSKKAAPSKRRTSKTSKAPQVCLAQTAVRTLGTVSIALAQGLASHGHRLKMPKGADVMPFEAEVEGEIRMPRSAPKKTTKKAAKAAPKRAKRSKKTAKRAAPKTAKRGASSESEPRAGNGSRECGAVDPKGRGVCRQPARHKGKHSTVDRKLGEVVYWQGAPEGKTAPKRAKRSKRTAKK